MVAKLLLIIEETGKNIKVYCSTDCC